MCGAGSGCWRCINFTSIAITIIAITGIIVMSQVPVAGESGTLLQSFGDTFTNGIEGASGLANGLGFGFIGAGTVGVVLTAVSMYYCCQYGSPNAFAQQKWFIIAGTICTLGLPLAFIGDVWNAKKIETLELAKVGDKNALTISQLPLEEPTETLEVIEPQPMPNVNNAPTRSKPWDSDEEQVPRPRAATEDLFKGFGNGWKSKERPASASNTSTPLSPTGLSAKAEFQKLMEASRRRSSSTQSESTVAAIKNHEINEMLNNSDNKDL